MLHKPEPVVCCAGDGNCTLRSAAVGMIKAASGLETSMQQAFIEHLLSLHHSMKQNPLLDCRPSHSRATRDHGIQHLLVGPGQPLLCSDLHVMIGAEPWCHRQDQDIISR